MNQRKSIFISFIMPILGVLLIYFYAIAGPGDPVREGIVFDSIAGGDISASRAVSGASLFSGQSSGVTLDASQLNVMVLNDTEVTQVYILPAISGVSTMYFSFDDSAYGGGITVFATDSEPFMGSGLSGTAYLWLPPGHPFESASVRGYKTGITTYWKVEADSDWVAGN